MNERKVLDYTGWASRIENVGVNTPWSLENLLELDRRILDMQERLQGTDIGSFDYKSLANDMRESMQGIDVLYRYATDTERAIDEMDTAFMTALSKGAVEDLSLIRMDDITVDNTIGMKETYMVGYGDSRCAVERTKDKLTLNDFIGGEGAGCMTGYVKEFADLFRSQYLEAGGKEENFSKYLKELYTMGEFDHKKYQPVRTFVSNVLDVVLLGSKPLLEGLLQYEFITGETLTDDESVFKVVEGVVSLFTFWMGTAGKGAGTIAEAFLAEAAAGTTTEVVNYLGEEMGLPPIVRSILALGIGLEVGGRVNQYFADKDQLLMNFEKQAGQITVGNNGGRASDIGYMKNNSDPMRDMLGAGRYSSPEEWNSIIQNLEKSGVEINYREGNMAYSPGLTKGSPGQLIIDPDASLSALKHEYQHFLDAQAEGFPSFKTQMFENPKTRVIKELKAYMVEVKEADRLGLKETSEQLFENYRREREWIVNQYVISGGE